MARLNSGPSYLFHKQSGSAICAVRTPAGKRKQILLGPYGSDESKAEYARVLRQVADDQVTEAGPNGISMAALCVRFLKHAESYYRDGRGKPTSEVGHYKSAVGAITIDHARHWPKSSARSPSSRCGNA